jgi:hypothetical protein
MGDSTTLDELKQLITALSTNVTTLAADVSTIKADQTRLHVAVNKVQSDVVGDGSSTSGGKGKVLAGDGTAGGPATATHKLRFPTYDGGTDPLAWLHKCDQFFRAARTPDEEKTWYAAYYLEGDAQQWYFRLECNQGAPTWDRFVDLVSRRFGPLERSNPLGELIKLQRAGSVAEFQDQFLRLLDRCDGVTEQQQIAIYTAGLGDPLRIDVELQRPVTLEDAMSLSRAFERRNAPVEHPPASGRPPSHTSTRASSAAPAPVTPVPTPTPTAASTPGAPQCQRPPAGTRFTRLTAEEMAQRREAGLCYNCPAKYSK